MSVRLSRRIQAIRPSAIREILKVTERPDVISFAGGLPAPEAFPIADIARAHAEVLATQGAAALQYGPTEGFAPLRDLIAQRAARRGLAVRREGVLITSGSQQGLDLVAKALLDPGDTVIVEEPTYLAALQTFSTYEANFAVVGSDEQGMRTDEVEQILRSTRARLIYLVANFQNPAGTTLSLQRRAHLARLSAEHGVMLLDDDPYGELRYGGVELPSLAALDPRASVITLGSFSKTLAPGLRLGWALGDERTVRALTVAKQAADLHTATLAQRAVAQLFSFFDYEAHLRKLRALYGERCAAMLAALDRHLPPGAQWTRPDGGLFVWLKLPGGLDAEQLLHDCMRERVAFVPGAPFFAHTPQRDTLRLNFSNRPPEMIAEGIARLGECVQRRLEGRVHVA
jgi:2-aminoadipate transaminase